ncbi:RICIN domain-containing protein [Streptomyces cinnabarinus]|uniref:RICIN domain-containing protein n=1 Tax=Streptomyces cinnabarinus TaxID=67287 RepID=A0ABY7KE02_9ACTN|nr:RICIN domain-containing protein [Streptomyces cinnabarinus]WAZ22755.1 RICIN domain-containing protein [Streptomyces cinnabarinus]
MIQDVRCRRITTTALVLTAALTSVLLPAPGTAAAREAADTVQSFRSRATFACLDDSSEHGLRTTICHNNSHQKWTVHVWADGTRRMRNHATGLCLADYPDGDASTQPCDQGKDESWIVHRFPNGDVELKNQKTGRCLDDSEHGLRTFPCGTHTNPSLYQSWF